jgi:hypothetical protein
MKYIQSINQVKSWQKTLSTAPEIMKHQSKLLQKVCSGNALPIFDSLVTTAKSFKNHIEAHLMALTHC